MRAHSVLKLAQLLPLLIQILKILDDPMQAVFQLPSGKRLGDIAVAVYGNGSLQVMQLIVQAAKDNASAKALCAQGACQLDACHARHFHIADQNIRLHVADDFQRVIGVFAHADDVQRQLVEGAHRVRKVLTVNGKVIHDQHAVHLGILPCSFSLYFPSFAARWENSCHFR